jgi:hypothetical protein
MTETQAPATPASDTIDLAEVATLDLASLTLGEMAEAERQSGRSFDKLLTSGNVTRRLLALWVAELRSSAQPRSWHELSSLRPLGKRS